MGMQWIRRGTRAALLAVLAAATACGGQDGEVERLEGMEPLVMREMATEAFSMWDPASVQLVDMELVRGRRVSPDHYDLDIRYTVRKFHEPTGTTHEALAERAAASPIGHVAELAPRFRQLAQTEPGGTAEFSETIVLVPHGPTWIPQAWREQELARAKEGR